MRTCLQRLFSPISNLVFFVLLSTSTMGLFAQAPDSIIFRDDFERDTLGSLWEQNGSWIIVDGSAYNLIDGTAGTLKTATAYPQSSYIIETAARGFNSSYFRYFKFTFGQPDLSNSDRLYELTYTAWTGGSLTLSRSTDNSVYPKVLDEVAVFPNLLADTWYNFKIARYASGLIQVYIDDGSGYDSIPLLEAIDSTYPGLGHTGWRIETETFHEDFYVDWISASKPGVEKPAIREKLIEDKYIRQVTATSGKAYKVGKLIPGVKQLIDRDYIITSVPEYLKGASFIQTANADKSSIADKLLTFFVKADSLQTAIVYIGYDSRSKIVPGWLSEFTKVADSIGTSDKKVGYLTLYRKFLNFFTVFPYPVVLGGNLAAPADGAETNYLVAVVLPPNNMSLQAEDALVSGAEVARDHPYYHGTGFVDFKHPANDYIEWSAQIDLPGTYAIDFRYSNGSSASRELRLTVNGKDAGMVNFYRPFQGSWDYWSPTFVPTDVFLSAGINKIRLTATGASGPNIDELILEYTHFPITASSPAASAPVNLTQNYLRGKEIRDKIADHSYKVYPNPFVQSTYLYYQVKEKAKVNLAIYSVQGQQIQLLENRMREPGNYQAEFNAGKLAKGIYFYRLQIGNDVKTGKLLKN